MLISDEVRNALLNAGTALVNGGDMLFRESTTTIFDFALKATAFGAAAAGNAALDVASPAMTATASASVVEALDNYQIRTNGGLVRMSGDIGELGSGAEIEINHVDAIIGDVCTIDEYILTMPAGA